MSHPFIIHIHLRSIRSFLERVGKSVDNDYLEIMRRADAGEFSDEDEEDNAFYEPTISEEIAIRATLGELNALIESELQSVAAEPLAQEQVEKRPKRDKIVWDLKKDDLYRLIESYYNIRIVDLPGSEEVEEIRRTVNAYKHRKGFKDPRKDVDAKDFLEKFQLEREKTLHQIESVRDFLQALSAITKRKQESHSE